MVSLIFLIIDIEILVILLYISSYFITSELCIIPPNTNTRNNDLIKNKNNNNDNNNNNNNNNNSNNNKDFNNNISNITEKLEKWHCFQNFGGVIAAQGVIYHARVRKYVIKLQQIINKHKQAFISTAI